MSRKRKTIETKYEAITSLDSGSVVYSPYLTTTDTTIADNAWAETITTDKVFYDLTNDLNRITYTFPDDAFDLELNKKIFADLFNEFLDWAEENEKSVGEEGLKNFKDFR